MVSGVTGQEFAAEIFIGPVYYQRLRHMVSDKFQVHSLMNLTSQHDQKAEFLKSVSKTGNSQNSSPLAIILISY